MAKITFKYEDEKEPKAFIEKEFSVHPKTTSLYELKEIMDMVFGELVYDIFRGIKSE